MFPQQFPQLIWLLVGATLAVCLFALVRGVWQSARRRRLAYDRPVSPARDFETWIRAAQIFSLPVNGPLSVVQTSPAHALSNNAATRKTEQVAMAPIIYRPSGALDHRSSVRRRGNPSPVEIMRGSSKPCRGWVLDRSTTGLCLTVCDPVDIGSTISVRSTQYGESGPWISAQVQHCALKEKNTWVFGCRFVERQPWGVLLLFG